MCFRHHLINKRVFWNDKNNHVKTTFGIIEEVLDKEMVRVHEIKSLHVMDTNGNWQQEPNWHEQTQIYHIKSIKNITMA